MKAINIFCISLLMMVDLIFAQPDFLWYKLYTYANFQDYPYKMATDSSKNIYIVGITEASSYPQTNFDAVILKYDSLGNLLWTRRHSLIANGFYDAFIDLLVCDSGKVLVSGNMQTGMSSRLVSIMYGPAGDTVWNKTYQQQGYLIGEFNTTRRIINDSNSNFAIIDYVGIEPYSKLLIVKYDHDGQNQEVYYSDMLIGGPPTDIQVIQRDSIYIYVSYAREIAPNLFLPAVIKFDAQGNKAWEKVLLDTTISFKASKIVIDDSLNIYSTFYQEDYGDTVSFLTKLDPNGNILWTSRFEVTSDEELRPQHLIRKSDGSIYIIGQYIEWNNNETGDGIFFLKYDENGNLLKVYKKTLGRTIDWIPAAKVSSNQNLYILIRSRLTYMHLGDFHIIKFDTNDEMEYTLIYDYQNWGSRSEEGVDFVLFEDDDFAITGGGGPGILAISIVTVRFGTYPLSVNETNTIQKYVLYQNYPNPFNPSTTIKFALPVDSKVKINVYNSLGQLVETLVDKEMESGYHEVNFNASKLASGVYLYQLQAGNYVSVKKMLLLK